MKAFTLIEVLIYVAITAIIGGLFTGILLTVSQVHQRESAATEVGSQLNFVNQRIGHLVRESSNIEIPAGVSTSTLKLRMAVPSRDPTCISLVNGVVRLAEGPGVRPGDCSTTTSNLTNNRVIVNSLNFRKFTAYPGHDTVSIDIQLTFNSPNPRAQVTRNLTSGIARVSAATFDSNILPGAASFQIGQIGSPWLRVFLADGTALNPSYTFGNNTGLGLFRGGANILSFTTAGLERMRIDAAGNVGIGTTTPPFLLTLRNPIAGGDGIGWPFGLNVSSRNWLIRPDQVAFGDLAFITSSARIDGQADVVRMVINPAGNVGIGTTGPAHPLQMGSGAHVTGAGVWTNASDITLKKDIREINYGLSALMNLQPRTYRMKSDGTKQIGFIAQEMELIIPELVSGQEGEKGIGYGNLTAVLVKAVQEQQKEIEELKAEIKKLKFRLAN